MKMGSGSAAPAPARLAKNPAVNSARERWTLDAGLVFVGYGVTAPELGHDDYAGLDTRGRCVVVLSGAPPKFPGDQRAHWHHHLRPGGPRL